MNIYFIIGVLALASLNIIQYNHNDALTVKLRSAQKDVVTAQANELHNGKSAEEWEKVANDTADYLSVCQSQKATNAEENAKALAAANKQAADADAKLAVWQHQFTKLARSGQYAPLLSTRLPDEVLP